ncbi:hypothetical protein RUND412_004065 [Rhizina undulata]
MSNHSGGQPQRTNRQHQQQQSFIRGSESASSRIPEIHGGGLRGDNHVAAFSHGSPPDTTRPPPRNRRLSLPRDLRYDISRLQRSDWVNLDALVSCAVSKLGKEKCVGISELGRGSHNSLYKLEFSDSSSCAASISNAPPQFFSERCKLSEIATMQYIYSSPLYNIPIPRILAWDLSFKNPVGAPYILREVVPGKNMAEEGRFYRLSAEEKMKIIQELAFVQAELSKPSEFNKIGSIYRRDFNAKGSGEGEFYVDELIAARGDDVISSGKMPSAGPYSSLPELWQARLERETLSAIRNWSTLRTDTSFTSQFPSSQANPQQFGELLQLMSGLTNLFAPPKELATLCIQHSDLAIRNVLFDEKTLKITGVIDWEFASVMPLVITGRFPNDLGWEGNEFARFLGKLGPYGEVWNHHYFDWTNLNGVHPPLEDPTYPDSPCIDLLEGKGGDYLSISHATSILNYDDESEEFQEALDIPSPPSPPRPPPPTSKTSQKDLDIRASRLVELFYYRKYYASCVASKDFCFTTLFIDSVAYVKFNEVVMGGYEKWFAAANWIEEVYWRLKKLDKVTLRKLQRGESVIRVPEVFSKKMDRKGVDLGEWEKRVNAAVEMTIIAGSESTGMRTL